MFVQIGNCMIAVNHITAIKSVGEGLVIWVNESGGERKIRRIVVTDEEKAARLISFLANHVGLEAI